MAGLSHYQRRVLHHILSVGRRDTAGWSPHARRLALLAAVETSRREANFGNPAGGEGSSVGWRQETAESYPGLNRRNIRQSAHRFFQEIKRAGPDHFRTPGQLADAVQRPAQRGVYDNYLGEAKSILGAAGKGALGNLGSGGGGGQTARGVEVSNPGPGGEGVAALLRQMLDQQKPAPPVSAPAPVAFSAQAPTPKGYQPTPESGPPAPKQSIDDLLGAVQGIQGANPVDARGFAIGGGGGAKGGGGGGSVVGGMAGYPLAKKGKIIGTPYAGTHNLGNWQSDRAYDIGVPVGTPVLSTSGGRVEKVSAGGSGRFAGIGITVRGDKGDEYFFKHLSSSRVKPGQRVRPGQVLGKSGSANGVAHLHFARRKGNIKRTVRG